MASDGTISYNGDEYIMVIKLIRTTGINTYDNITKEDTISLPTSNMTKLEIVNDFVNPIMTGYMDYTDGSESYFDGYVGSNNNYIFIGIKKLNRNTSLSTDTPPTFEWSFTHMFIIDSIDILNREKDQINYGIKFTSINWFNFKNAKPYSTHNQPKPPFISDTLKSLYTSNGLIIGSKFTDFKSVEDNRQHFISHAGQTLTSMSSTLISQLNNVQDMKVNGLTNVVYNHMDDSYDIWTSNGTSDGNDSNTQMTDSIKITLNTNMLSNLIESEETKIWLKNYSSQIDTTSKLRDWTEWLYDYKINEFIKIEHTQQQIIESLTNTTNTDYVNKLMTFDSFIPPSISMDNRVYSYERSSWNTSDMYNRIMGVLTKNNILTLHTSGNFLRSVGKSIYLGIDIDNGTKSPLQYLMGWWICLRVRHIFTPTTYTNNVMLGRFIELDDMDKQRGI